MTFAKSRELKPFSRENRIGLSKKEGKTDYFTATFVRRGFSKSGQTMLVSGVLDSSKRFIARHIWLPLVVEAQHLNFGDRFEFEGTITRYEKGTPTDNMIFEDFTINNPTNVLKIGYAGF